MLTLLILGFIATVVAVAMAFIVRAVARTQRMLEEENKKH
jgi:uncharacterized membrane protein